MDQCLVDGSPWLFAVTHVLHRFLAPRHPPLALCSLEEQRCSCLLCSSQGTPHAGRLRGACNPRRRSRPPEGSRRTPGVEGFESLKTEEKTRSAIRSSKED